MYYVEICCENAELIRINSQQLNTTLKQIQLYA